MRAYIDTNILVDLVLSRQEFLPDAQRGQRQNEIKSRLRTSRKALDK